MNHLIQDKAPKPPGLLPKHVQSWLIAGLAVLMVLIMWLTGSKTPQITRKPTTSAVVPPPLADVSEGKIAELQSRIEQLQREQLVAQNALAQQSRVLAGSASETAAPAPASGPVSERVEDPIEAERKKRNYLSLFSSNVALSYRKNPSASAQSGTSLPNSELGSALAPPSADVASLAQFLKALQPPVAPVVSSQTPPPISAAAGTVAVPQPEKKEVSRMAQGPVLPSATGKSYVLFEGTILEAVLINRLDGSLAGPIQCLTTADAYSHDRQQLLIPAGSRLLGETRKVEALGAMRLAVVFHRLIMPDGYSVSLDQFRGLNQAGDAGLRDRVNNHYLQIFGTSLALGALGAVAEAGTGTVLTESGVDRMREGFASSTAQSAERILDRFLNILPTITIREGHRVKVYLSGDLSLPAYSKHTMPSDL